MKHPLVLDRATSLSKSLASADNIKLSGFHPDLFPALINLLDCKIYIRVSDDCFGLILQHLSLFWNRDDFVFVDGSSFGDAPVGFVSDSGRFLDRSRCLLSDGLGGCVVVVCSDSGIDVPVLGSKSEGRLLVNEALDYNACCDFLTKEGYSCVDVVMSPGEFCRRGGLVDVFPYSSFQPFRINFFEPSPSVFSFDIDTQLTRSSVTSLEIVSLSAGKRLPLSDVVFDGFLRLHFFSGNILVVGA